jgi:Rrf2 family protein
MQFTRKGDYALRAMVYLADFNDSRPHTIEEIAKGSQIPHHFLAKILRDLTQAKLLIAAKGARGGYRLARRASEISLLEVIEAAVGPVALNLCVEGPDRCAVIESCGLHPVMEMATQAIRKIFGKTDLDSVLAKQGR